MPSVNRQDTRCCPSQRQQQDMCTPTASQDGLDAVRGGSRMLKQNARGLEVAAAQKALQKSAPQLKVDGRFGPKTEAAVRDFQRQHQLKVDGIIGPETMKALDAANNGQSPSPAPAARRQPADPATQQGRRQAARQADQTRRQQVDPQQTDRTTSVSGAAPANASEAQKYDHYKKMIDSRGGKFRSGPGQKNIVGLRNETNYKSARGGKYDDKVVMLWKDKNGNKRVREYKSNMDPAGRNEGRFGKDVNRDGRRDLGRVSEGYAEYKMGVHYGRARRYGSGALKAKALRPTGSMKVDRDTNHDGKFTGREIGNSRASDMLFHMGGNNNTSSAGCQTMPPGEWSRFWRDLTRDGQPGTIGYTVINR